MNIKAVVLRDIKLMIPWFWFSLGLLCLEFLGPSIGSWLQLRQPEISHGEIWRIISGHLVHLNLYHTLLNIGVLLAWSYLFSDQYRFKWWMVWYVVFALIISCCLIVFSPDVAHKGYLGMSGVIYAAIAFSLVLSCQTDRLCYLFLLVLIVKIGAEQLPGYDVNYLQDEIGGAVAIDSHLYGLLAGLTLAAGVLMSKLRTQH